MGSFAAVQGTPGWSLPVVYYHTSADADRGRSFRHGTRITGGLEVDADLLMAVPTYVFSTPVVGAQATFSMATLIGRAKVGFTRR
jgi:hypothetical protein